MGSPSRDAVRNVVLLESVRGRPARLEALGFSFRHPQLDGALAEILHPGR